MAVIKEMLILVSNVKDTNDIRKVNFQLFFKGLFIY